MALLLTWTDRGAADRPDHHTHRRSDDRGPILRLLEQPEYQSRYDGAWVLTTPAALEPAQALVTAMQARISTVALRILDVADPSDHEALFRALGPLLRELPGDMPIDVLLSAGTPQVQTLWVILVQAGLLRARMLQVIPPTFVPVPHPKAVREVRLEIDGFPEIRALRDEVVHLRAQARLLAGRMVGESAPMQALLRRAARVAPANLPVLILGETGTGKELLARALHDASPRAGGPFIAENCAAFSEGVLQSELFGHERGAFTGASGRRRGLFEMAHGGTLFLDEVGEMPSRVQVSLLRVLQEGELRRVGGEAPVKVDVRIVAATHRDLQVLVKSQAFREDLYYRLCGATLDVPPLRARTADLERLVRHFQDELGPRRLALTREAWQALRDHAWPGNIRELRAEVQRWSVFCDSEVRLQDLSPGIRGERAAEGTATVLAVRPGPRLLAEAVAEAERVAIEVALGETDRNILRTARLLGIDRNTLKRKLQAYGLGQSSARGRT